MLRVSIAIAAVAFITTATAGAEPRFDPVGALYQWLWPRKAAPPIPSDPVPAPLPVPAIPEALVIVPPPAPFPDSAPAPAPVAEPQPQTTPQKSQPSAQPKSKPKPQAHKPAQPKTLPDCKPLPPVDCRQVCSYAHLSESTLNNLRIFAGYCEPTSRQRAQGKACIREHCPAYLSGK